MSELARLIIAENIRTKNPFLDLGCCGLRYYLPEELFECVWIERLNLGDIYFDEENEIWTPTSNPGDNNRFNGEELSILKKLTFLKSLYLRSNKIYNISFLENLITLQSLYLRYNHVREISSLNKLPVLKLLDLRHNEISAVRYLETFPSLKFLNLSYNEISYIQIREKLNNLQFLDLSYNRISDIGFLNTFPSLQSLDLSYNNISDIQDIEKLPSLQTLNLSHNQISIPKALYSLNNLTNLVIDKDIYNSTPFIKNLIEGQKKISIYPKKIMDGDRTVTLQGNPIFPPLPIIQQGENAIIAYYYSLSRGKKPINEVKILLVGDGAAGKTSLVKMLTGKAFNSSEKQTHGIQIQDNELIIKEELLKVHYWDFGGQEIMHATHQFFLTKDSIYILVLDGRRDENPEYWLKHIATFGGNAPVMVVLNKAEDNRAYDIVKQDLTKKYPNIKGFFKASCKTREGIEKFSSALHQEIFDLDFRKTPFGVDWETVKESLRKMEQPHITYQQYYKLCEDSFVFDKNQQDTLLGYLNSLGVILHFEELKQYDTQVLNPLWLTQAVYRVINSPRIAQKAGQFDESELFEVLNDDFYQNEELEYDESLLKKLLRWFGPEESKMKRNKIRYEDHTTLPFIAKVMQQFELSYNLPKTTSYIIPDLLPIEPSIIINYNDYPLHFATEFYFLPPALLPRFIVQTNFNVVDAVKWRTGVVLNAEGVFNAEAVVRVDKESKMLHIFVKGEQKRELLVYIRSVFHGLYASYDGLKQEGRVTELLFLPDRPDLSVPYKEIEGLEELGEEYYTSGKAKKKYKLTELFGEIENPDYKLSYIKEKPVKIFISYSRKKKKFREELVTKLFPLIGLKDNYLEVWHDEQLEPASSWAKDIDESLDNSDIIVCLLSDHYLASYYCMYEFKRAKEKDKLIYPILINDCGWQDTEFKSLQGYFIALEPIPAAKRPQRWQEVYEKVKLLVQKVKETKK